MDMLSLSGSVVGIGFALFGILAPQRLVNLCLVDPLDLSGIGRAVLRLFTGTMLIALLANMQQVGDLPALPDLGALTQGKLSQYNNAAEELLAPPDLPMHWSGAQDNTGRARDRHRRYHEDY